MTTIGIMVFDGVEELDFVGPWEVFTSGKLVHADHQVFTMGVGSVQVRCAKGLRVTADHTLDDAPALDVLVVPGGEGTRPLMQDQRVLAFIRARAASAKWTVSVCSGALLLAQAGLLDGRKATTHWAVLSELRRFANVEVVERVRFVRDGQIVTSAGVSAGIDMALWLFGQLSAPGDARKVQHIIQYEPAPPYQALV